MVPADPRREGHAEENSSVNSESDSSCPGMTNIMESPVPESVSECNSTLTAFSNLQKDAGRGGAGGITLVDDSRKPNS